MSRYNSLIRLRKWELDNERRILSDLERERDTLAGSVARIEADMQSASDQAATDNFSALTLGRYMQAARLQRQKLLDQVARHNTRIRQQQDKIFAGFQDLKTIEVAAENADRLETERLNKKEQAALEETAMQAYVRGKMAKPSEDAGS